MAPLRQRLDTSVGLLGQVIEDASGVSDRRIRMSR
jgi:hypothetical protein